ncbi:MAG TPA: hypothetical protein IAA99_02770 [Candidatus Avibacteroides faecavium]|nr:hypothetical protein [Candidatus Avibacteroides faecavium]
MAKSIYLLGASLMLALCAASCSDDEGSNTGSTTTTDDGQLSEEWYAGGVLGTAFNSTSSAYEQSTPAVDQSPTMAAAFLRGETFFEDVFIEGNEGGERGGLGPLWIRNGCIYCHPGYGHGKRMERYNAGDFGNGYLLVIYDKRNDAYLTSLTGMPQTRAVAPFKAPIDESKIKIEWREYTDEWGNRFEDGETYSLIYPEVTIPEDAYYVPLESGNQPIDFADVGIRLESTIGIYGTGLLDAIPDDSLKAEYARQEEMGMPINPAFFKDGQWVKMYANSVQGNGQQEHPFRFTYALSRGPLQDAAGSNAIWNITNVTRSDRRYHYMTATYATVASQDPDVQAKFYEYFPEWQREGHTVEEDIYNYLMNQELPVEMTDDEYVDFYVWHRGLAVPAARNLDDPKVQEGKRLFYEMGCTVCHRPSWTTGEDNFTDPSLFFEDGDERLPRYPYQKIWPYSDLVQHRLNMVNDIRTGWCRTTPLWGRGLSQLCAGHSDRLHDCRARNVIEAIMWHGDAQSDARLSVEKFRQLSKDERDAVVEFINAI